VCHIGKGMSDGCVGEVAYRLTQISRGGTPRQPKSEWRILHIQAQSFSSFSKMYILWYLFGTGT
jgi:hypothetical protein